MSYEIPFDSISNCPLRASDIGAGGVGKATADNYQGRLRFRLPGMVQSLLGPELHLLCLAKILSGCDFNTIERCHPQANRDSTIE
jgi:hypothetical protein